MFDAAADEGASFAPICTDAKPEANSICDLDGDGIWEISGEFSTIGNCDAAADLGDELIWDGFDLDFSGDFAPTEATKVAGAPADTAMDAQAPTDATMVADDAVPPAVVTMVAGVVVGAVVDAVAPTDGTVVAEVPPDAVEVAAAMAGAAKVPVDPR